MHYWHFSVKRDNLVIFLDDLEPGSLPVIPKGEKCQLHTEVFYVSKFTMQ